MKILIYLILFYLIIVLFLYIFQRQLIYFPSNTSISPAESGVPEMKEIHIKTDDGLSLKSWYRPPVNSNQPTIIFFHGNAGHIGHRAFIVKPFLDEGYGVFLLTYRGYSGNTGNPSEKGLYNDARAVMKFLKNEDCLVLYGNSIGAAVAIQMATEYPVEGIVLQSPFTSLMDLGQHHYPVLPVRWLTKDKYDSLSKVKNIHVPVLVLHGERDMINPQKFSRKLFQALPEPKKFISVPEKGHNDLFKPQLIIDFIKHNVSCD